MIKEREAKTSRKFKEADVYDQQSGDQYFLLPFRFHRLNEDQEIIVNEVGDYLIIPTGTYEQIVRRRISKTTHHTLYADLLSGFFISEEPISPLIDVLATRYRTKKSFLDQFTALHIFVISLRCEHTCHYCQVSRVTQDKEKYDMAYRYIDRGIDMMMQSPNPHVTMEFQGGEALLAFDNIVYAVERTKVLALEHGKQVTYVICTNLAVVTREMLEYCLANEILISTSLDGPSTLHNQNRKRPGRNSYELTIQGIELARSILGKDRVSALMTTTNLSLGYPEEIVDEYFNQGFRSIFLRPISPYGFAVRNERKNSYETDQFLHFYKKALDRIIEYNVQGHFFSEDYATIILRKVLTPFPVGYVDLSSPAGAITNAIVFNYDGAVYASDESRMLAEMNDFTFRLGHLDTHSYEEIFYGKKTEQLAQVWSNENLPGCSECAFQSYCGADPIHNHATQGDVWGYRPTSTFCQKNMEIIRYLIELMEKEPTVKSIFESWIRPRH
ncbi:His-Xaa-Ser system radical SAM maturase HxsB [Spirosoma pollinicola]|uniref:His-Xaa-Ser system radical SAM maturase HxsB n=1 Tax=Spirosoma pollinicola TaxID=2057025 RepID=A0A2K8Z6B5_9BACT|nr:His-Xaa-Ser system radical SAM maturase HxsB [Spirosoma pollinicola]AUD05400.1 His-Xaa-Ser system radical SAM maturase HxsB [Spirosoma pollinicola]